MRPKAIVIPRKIPALTLCLAAVLAFTSASNAQNSSSSSSAAAPTSQEDQNPVSRPRAAQIEEGGSAVSLETSEPLFQLAAALNACGYDADLDRAAPVRAEVRADMNQALAASEEARTSRDALCLYITQHHLSDTGLDIGQYVSLGLYLSPPPELTPNVDETQLPPQAAAVVNVLPLLRTFGEDTHLHIIWLRHRAEYEALAQRVHDPMVQMILASNIYLHQPVSSYDGRRFLVLLEPMLSSSLTNARIYGSDYIIVTAPDNSKEVPVSIPQIRHIYLHYVVEPMVYSRGAAMERMQPVLRSIQDAPLEFFYKSDVVALMTECLIKAIEARTTVIAEAKPKKLTGVKARDEIAGYNEALALYNRATALEQAQIVATDQKQGWVMTGYFYDQLGAMEKNGDGLRDEIAQMIYGMDIDHEKQLAERTIWAKEVPADPLRPAPRPRKIEGLDLAEVKLMQGKVDEAADLADAALKSASADHGRARYLLARVDLMQGRAEDAYKGFQEAIMQSKDPRTLAWAHIFLGRLHDLARPSERDQALVEYKAALANRDSRPDTRLAAEAGLKKPFAAPLRANAQPREEDEKDFDPTGKKEKDEYQAPK